MAPWPGFEPGSCGRQPHILGRAILPGLFVVLFFSLFGGYLRVVVCFLFFAVQKLVNFFLLFVFFGCFLFYGYNVGCGISILVGFLVDEDDVVEFFES